MMRRRKVNPAMASQIRQITTSRIANKGGVCRRPPLVSCCSLKIITTIKNNLNKKNLQAFEKSCFGHLLEMNPLKFQFNLLQHLLMHMDIAASNNKTLIFNINSSKLEFTPFDFESITGLSYGKSDAATLTSSRIHEDVFGSNASIMLRDVEEAFLDVCGDEEGGGELALKLALLYFLRGIVLPASHTKKIELSYLHLADDLPAFLAFPWGRVGYEFLASSALSTRLRLRLGAGRYTFPGFAFALQVWAYEKMPALAKHCAARVLNSESNRILNWSATKIIPLNHLKQFFTDKEVLSAEAFPKLQNVKVEPLTSSTSIPQEERRRMQSEDVVEPFVRESEVEDEEAAKEANPTFSPNPISAKNVKVEPLTWTCIPQEERRRMQSEGVVESLVRESEVEDEEAVKEANPTRHSTLRPNPISTNKSQSSSAEIERIRVLLDLAFDDNPPLDTPQLLWKTCREFEISKAEYERSKALYEMLLERRKRLKLWISYAQFEAFAMIEGSEVPDKRKCLERGRGVLERGLSYFRSCDPKMKEERGMLLEEWFDMEYRFGEGGDVGLVRAKLPQKLKKRRRVETEDGSARYEEYIDYLFP